MPTRSYINHCTQTLTRARTPIAWYKANTAATHLCQVNQIGPGVLEDNLETGGGVLIARKRGHDAKTPVWELPSQLPGGGATRGGEDGRHTAG